MLVVQLLVMEKQRREKKRIDSHAVVFMKYYNHACVFTFLDLHSTHCVKLYGELCFKPSYQSALTLH